MGVPLLIYVELTHQLLDITADARLVQAVAARLLRRSSGSADSLPFGLARLSVIVRFGVAVCVMAVCLLLVTEAFHGALHGEEATAAAVAARVEVDALRLLVAAAAVIGSTAVLQMIGARAPASSHAIVRAVAMLSCALVARHAQSLPKTAAALMDADGTAAVVAAAVAAWRGNAQARRTGRVLLQGVPSALLPALDQRLLRVRELPGVDDTRDESFWLLDEERALGSLRLVVAADADAEQAAALARHILADVLHHCSVQVEVSAARDEADDELKAGPPPQGQGGPGTVDVAKRRAQQRR